MNREEVSKLTPGVYRFHVTPHTGDAYVDVGVVGVNMDNDERWFTLSGHTPLEGQMHVCTHTNMDPKGGRTLAWCDVESVDFLAVPGVLGDDDDIEWIQATVRISHLKGAYHQLRMVISCPEWTTYAKGDPRSCFELEVPEEFREFVYPGMEMTAVVNANDQWLTIDSFRGLHINWKGEYLKLLDVLGEQDRIRDTLFNLTDGHRRTALEALKRKRNDGQ